jgi:hypothetical protein
MRIFTDIYVSKERGYYQPHHYLQALNFKKLGAPWRANCAKSIVTGGVVESGVKGYVVPEGGLPWPEWIKT